MPIHRLTKGLKPTTTKNEVPLLYHEPHVETGFRHIHQPWSYYACSLFQKHNECMNVWTHLIGVLLTISRVIGFAIEFGVTDPKKWSLYAGLFTMTVMYMCSTFAHCFSNKSELVHYTGFMIDYAGIGLFGFGSVMLHYSYCIKDSMKGGMIDTYAIPIGIFLGWLVTFCNSVSKVRYTRPYPFTRKLWQLIPVASIYTFLILPILHRIYLYFFLNEPDPSIHDHIQQIIWFMFAGFFFGSDIPQRFFPGKFDFLGHSHQIFHICILFVTLNQLDAVYVDLHKMNISPYHATFMGSFGAVLLVLLGNIIIVLGFHMYVRYKILPERRQLHHNGKQH